MCYLVFLIIVWYLSYYLVGWIYRYILLLWCNFNIDIWYKCINNNEYKKNELDMKKNDDNCRLYGNVCVLVFKREIYI